MDRPRFSLMWFLFSFNGRIGRMGYWAYTFATVVAMVALLIAVDGIVDLAIGDAKVPKGSSEAIAWWLFVALGPLALLYFWTNYAVLAKRWHDRGKSGWWSLIGLVPYIGGIWILVECGFLKGNDGPNAYGHDPKALNVAEVFE